MHRLLIVQPYIPQYRVAFFHALREVLRARDVALTLAAGNPCGLQAARGDADVSVRDVHTSSRSISIHGRRLRWQGTWRRVQDFDGVIVEASGAMLDSSMALLRNERVGLWGHIDGFVSASNQLDARIERWQLRRAGVVLAYTPRGAAKAVAVGVDPARVVTLNNTIDTAELRAATSAMTTTQARAHLGIQSWGDAPVFAFIGGLDDSKRLEFLAGALDRLHESHPSVKVVVAGSGPGSGILQRSVERDQVRLIGRGGVAEKAALAQVAQGILMPGRVGLIAVDSFALGLPIITTEWPWHGPEFEYLTSGVDSVVTADSVAAYAAAVARAVDQPDKWARVREAALERASTLSLDTMVGNFARGVDRLLA